MGFVKPSLSLSLSPSLSLSLSLYIHTHILQDDEPVARGFEESEEVDPEKSQLVCSDSYTAKSQKTSKKKKKK